MWANISAIETEEYIEFKERLCGYFLGQKNAVEIMSDSEEQVQGENKKFVRFRPGIDILLLREVLTLRPKKPKDWEKVLKNLNEGLNIECPGSAIKALTNCQKRFKDLMKAFKSEEMESLRASGTDEEYREREQLLTELRELEEEDERQKEEKTKAEKLKEEQGKELRQKAMQRLKQKREEEKTESDEEENGQNEIISPKTKKRRRTGDNSVMSDYMAFLEKKHENEK